MKILIAGLGSIGRRHFRNLLTLGEGEILLYRTHRSTLPDDELAGFSVESDLNKALAWGPQAVIVANPTALHLEVAIPAARQGCHLLLEKPVAHTLERRSELNEAVLSGGGQVLVGFQYRFHPGLREVARLLAEGAIGKPLSARAVYAEYLPEMHPWEDYRQSYSARQDLGGGVVLTLCHPIDYLRWLLGEPRSLWAFGGHFSDLELDVTDTAEIGLLFNSSLVGSLHLDYNRQPGYHGLEITGALGTIVWDQADLWPRIFTPAKRAWETMTPAGYAGRTFERNDMFLEEMRHFIQVAGGEAAPLCTLDDGWKALQIALAVQESAYNEQIVRF